LRGCGLRQSLDDALAGENAAVDNVGPFGDPQSTTVVLLLDGVANIDEFPVLEDQKVVLLSQHIQAIDSVDAEIGEDIDVCLDDGDVGAEICILKC
jgi:hypothetical protein